MFNIIPLILILLSLSAIIVIVARKFSVLANLDVESIPAEREARIKEQIIGKRLKRNFVKYYSKLVRLLLPLGKGISQGFKWSYQKLLDFKENYNQEKASPEKREVGAATLLSEAEECFKAEKFDEAEDKYIEAIGIDSTNYKAFRCLGQLYSTKKNYVEAKQTLEHAIKLIEKELTEAELAKTEATIEGERKENLNHILALSYYDLSQVVRAQENHEEALKILNKALRIEPNNPKYLDTKFEISIINKDKVNALNAYEKMQEVNPENQKLPELKKQIDEL